MYIGLHVKYPLILSNFNETWIFPTDIRRNAEISNFMKICPVWAELFYTDGRDEAKSRFSQLCESV